jgi:hypothetical protein
MATTVSAAFDYFFQEINLSGDHREIANNRRDAIVKLLRSKLDVIDSFASGSIPKFTALRGHADLDVIVVLHYAKHIQGNTCTQVLQEVRDALAGWTNSVRRNGQAITLKYTTWPNVDIVPVAKMNDSAGNFSYFLVPNSNDNVWIKSRPKQHSEKIEAKASECGPNFRKIIKMAKEWNRTHGKYLQSYHLEVLALHALHGPQNDLPWNLFQFFESTYNLTATKLWYDVGYADDYLTVTDRIEARSRLATARDLARDAWYQESFKNDDKAAIGKWKQVLGERFPYYG